MTKNVVHDIGRTTYRSTCRQIKIHQPGSHDYQRFPRQF